VRNGSFEEHASCPTTQDELPLCDYWVKANSCTVDYVCACAPSNMGGIQAPNYWMGYQQPFQGQCYTGIGVYYDLGPGTSDMLISEYIQTEITSVLLPQFEYKIQFYISLANHSDSSIDNFGAFVSAVRPDQNPGCWIFASTPQLTVTYLTDTSNWVKVEQTFLAQGGEKWLTIGRFDFDGLSQLLAVIPDTTPYAPVRHSYYVLDSVSLIQITSLENLPDFQNVFSPNEDGFNDFYSFPDFYFFTETQMEIFNRWGEKVFELNRQNSIWTGQDFKGNKLSEGVYYYIFSGVSSDGNSTSKKGMITLFR
jgi:gliding motility-associated-like protein